MRGARLLATERQHFHPRGAPGGEEDRADTQSRAAQAQE